jgi:hypothetical protein
MRTYLIAGAAALLLAAPAMAQTVTRETTTTREYTAPVMPAPVIVPPPVAIPAPPPVAAMPGTTYQSTTTTQYGDSGYDASQTRTERYIGTDGLVHTDSVTEQHDQ